MNANFERDGQPMTEEERLRQSLAAVVLGEASEDERAEIERALASSPELRAERERLAKTVGLFQSSLKDGDRLSPGAQAELQAALTRRHRRPWYTSNAFRIAAAFALIAGGVAAWRAFEREQKSRTFQLAARSELEQRPAALDAGRANERLAKEGEISSLRKLGYAADEEQKASDLTQAPASSPTAVPKNEPVQLGEKFAKVEQPTLGRTDNFGLPAAGELTVFEQADSKLQAGIVGWTEADKKDGGDYRGPGDSVAVAPAQVAGRDSQAPAAPEASDNAYRLRFSAADQTMVARVTPSERSQLPAAGAGGPASPGPAGPSSPGSSGPASSQKRSEWASRAAGSDEFFSAAPARDDSEARGKAEERQALTRLGYSGGDSERARDGDRNQIVGTGGGFGRQLAPAEIDERVSWMLQSCRRYPGERPRDMFFRFWGDNPFEYAQLDRLSTFSIDVDTASYALARKYLTGGNLPEKAQIRTEEFVNYFKPDVAPPTEGVFAIQTEMAPSLFGSATDGLGDKWMLRVAVRGKEVSKAERKPLRLTFVIDVSGSMRENNRLELVKHCMRLLSSELDARDSIAMVTFSNDAHVVLPMTSVTERAKIESAIDPLQPQNSTNTEAGLRLGYELAAANLSSGADNRVVLLTDGVANVGVTDPNALTAQSEERRKLGIYLNTIGVGMNNHNDVLLEQLADKGDGLCNYVDDAQEARRALVDNFTGALQTIARDVKIQVDFDPAQVERYRLLGYENRAIADADFRNDKVDAGEVGAGHQVAALYELMLKKEASPDGALATVRLRYKEPFGEGGKSEASESAKELAQPVHFSTALSTFEKAGNGYRRAVLVAQFAEFLRRSVHARGDSLDELVARSQALAAETKDPEVLELAALVQQSRALVLAELQRQDELQSRLDELRRGRCRHAELQELGFKDQELLAQLDRKNDEMEGLLEELLRRRLQEKAR